MRLVHASLFVLASIVLFSAHCGPTNHDCDVSTFVAHCDSSGALVTCVDEAPGDCSAKEGCDTHVVTTACGSNAEPAVCVATDSSASCEPLVNAEDGGSDANVTVDADTGEDAATD